MNQQTTVVLQQPQTGGLNLGPKQNWTTGLCGCFEDCGTCCIGYFCPLFLGCQAATTLDESCCVPCCLYGGTIAMRTKLRTLYNIQGSICCDWCVMTHCGQLALCQMVREMRNRGTRLWEYTHWRHASHVIETSSVWDSSRSVKAMHGSTKWHLWQFK